MRITTIQQYTRTETLTARRRQVSDRMSALFRAFAFDWKTLHCCSRSVEWENGQTSRMLGEHNKWPIAELSRRRFDSTVQQSRTTSLWMTWISLEVTVCLCLQPSVNQAMRQYGDNVWNTQKLARIEKSCTGLSCWLTQCALRDGTNTFALHG